MTSGVFLKSLSYFAVVLCSFIRSSILLEAFTIFTLSFGQIRAFVDTLIERHMRLKPGAKSGSFDKD